MGIFDKVKNSLVEAGLVEKSAPAEEQETDTEAEEVAPVARRRQIGKKPVTSTIRGEDGDAETIGTAYITPRDDANIGPDPEIVKALNEAVQNNSNASGYKEFRTIFDTMAGIPDSQRYNMSLKLLEATHKITPAQLLAAMEDHLRALTDEETSFNADYENEVKSAVEQVKEEISNIENDVETKKQEIRDLESKRITLTQTLGNNQTNLERERAVFNASYDVVHSALTTERDRIASISTSTQAK